MPLTILLPVAVLSIAFVGVLIRWLRPTPVKVFTSPHEVEEIWQHRNPETPLRNIHLNPSGTAALVETTHGPGILWAFGADPVTRLFDRPVKCRKTKTGLRIMTGDFTAPKLDILLPDPHQQQEWCAILEGPS